MRAATLGCLCLSACSTLASSDVTLKRVAAISIQAGHMGDVLDQIQDAVLREEPLVFMMWATDEVTPYDSPGVQCSQDCSLDRILSAAVAGTPLVWNARRGRGGHVYVGVKLPKGDRPL